MRYEYIHDDFRQGQGETAWRAIVAAIGVAEARALPPMQDPDWKPAEAGGGWVRVSEVFTVPEGDEEPVRLGTLFEG